MSASRKRNHLSVLSSMTDYRPRTKKTAENYVKLFILAHGRVPTDAEIPFTEFEDMDQASDEWFAIVAKIQIALGDGK